MATFMKCDGCGTEATAGHQWLRVRVEPFYPRPQNQYSRDEVPNDCYTEGLVAEACGPQCAALVLARQSGIISGTYENLSESFLRVSKKLGTDDGHS